MNDLKDILHELRCDIACIPRTDGNKQEIKNATKTLQKAWNIVKNCSISNVVDSAKTCDCGSGQTNFHKEIGCKECC